MNQKKALGRGLSALIPQKAEPAAALAQIPLDRIALNPYQPRKAFDEKAIDELTRSVLEHGIVQPVVVTRTSDNRYRLIAGERRFRAAQRAGLPSLPAVIKDLLQESDALQIALIENIQREDLNPIEEANAYHQLHDDFGLTQEEISKRVGKERSTVANFLRLLKLPEPVKKLLATGELSMGHARALLSLDSAKKQEKLADRIVRSSLNVRQAEMLASGPTKKKKREKPKDVFTRDAEEKLTKSLRTKVEINRRRRGGVIHIRFASEDDLMRIFDDLTGRRR
ncbi:MAG: chromosome partitioning protein ParB [Acidobacteria bacterium]|nr:MAG: chromosome partitioning protein ParB [Acidobacteriota bacterium]